MRQSMPVVILVSLLVLGLSSPVSAGSVDLSKSLVVKQFTASVKGAAGLPEAVRGSVVQTMRDDGAFKGVVKDEEAKDAPAGYVLEGVLTNFEAGNAAKRLMVGFGSGRSHAIFDFVLKDSTGNVVWKKSIKQTASFWFNGTTSSAAERAELPDGLAKKLVEELKKAQSK